MNEQKPIVEICNVSYTHWNQTEPTLKNVSLKIYPGTLNILVGPGGSGKSTLCDLFNGAIPHLNGGEMSGEVWVDGLCTNETPVKDLAQKVGRIFQDTETMFTTLYVEDEIAFGPENLCYSVEEIKQKVAELLELTDLQDRRINLVWNLSGGQVQKLGLAAVLAMNPSMIVLDEPTANLDPTATYAVHNLMRELRDQGITVLLVTRELDEFLAEADQLIVLNDGKVVVTGEPRKVLQEHGNTMSDVLGIWLPETTEIGLCLQKQGVLQGEIPITVQETVNALKLSGKIDRAIELPEYRQAAEAGEVLIRADKIAFTYPGGEVNALREVTLDIKAGEMLAIVGRNGAGKSTLAKVLTGLLKPKQGELMLFGKPARQWQAAELANHVALVLQNPEHQFLTDAVREEIEYSIMAKQVSEPDQVEAAVNEILTILGLEHVPDTHPFALSAGLKRRLGVATMLVGDPQILLVDEPTYGQDKQMTRTLMALMEDIRARGIGLVMITHDMRLVQEYAERVVVMNEGQVHYDGEFTGLFDRGELLERANLRPTLLHELINALRNEGVEINGSLRGIEDFLNILERE